MRAGRESREGTMRRSRRSSVSNFFKRKLSLSRGGSATRRSHGEGRRGERIREGEREGKREGMVRGAVSCLYKLFSLISLH